MEKTAEQTPPIGVLSVCADLAVASANARRDLALYDIASDFGVMRSDRVSALIEVAYTPPGEAVRDWSARMSMQDRQIALFQLAFSLGVWPAWFGASCDVCAAPVDLRVAVEEFQITQAPGPIPAKIEVRGPSGSLLFRVPTGVEERQIEAKPDQGLTEVCAPQVLAPQEDPPYGRASLMRR